MQNRAPKVYISVINWNSCANTIKCLDSLSHLDYGNTKILVIDNNSVDKSIQHIRRAFPDLEIVCSDVNRGYAGGHRLSLDRAVQENAELLWMLNNDVTVRPDALTELVNAYLRKGECLYGSLTLKSSDRLCIGFGGGWELGADGEPEYTNYNRFSGQSYDESLANMKERVVADLNGSSFMVPLAVLQQHGFMDECFFLYAEETDYCLRLAKKGVPSVIVPSSVVIHEGKGVLKVRPELEVVLRYYQKRNWLVLVRRHMGTRVYFREMLRQMRSCLMVWTKCQLLSARASSSLIASYYGCLAVRDALLNRMGKTVSPEKFLD